MKKLLSLPPNLVACFHKITGLSESDWFCTNDPVGHKLGSGGGSAFLLKESFLHDANNQSFSEWLPSEKRILLHAGGQSRRLPSYAPSGKILTPIPVFRWERGQKLSQDLLSLQLPLYEHIMDAAPSKLHTMIVSGDVYIRATDSLQAIPDADVVCYGLWLGPEIAKDHGVFVSSRKTPNELKCMLQKPSVGTLNGLLNENFYLTDIGVWLLSDKAVKILLKHSSDHCDGENISKASIKEYDLYGTFGCCLGTDPTIVDNEIKELKVAILPLPGGEFYHFGTSHELLSSTLAIQNIVNDQRKIIHHSLKPHPAMFVQNSITKIKITAENTNLWIENSYIGERWKLSQNNIITGVPVNNWNITLGPNQCIDVVPIGEKAYAIRRYNYYDKFAGEEQFKKQFPVVENINNLEDIVDMLSADDISTKANLVRLVNQRKNFRARNWPVLAENYQHSVFYQLDLENAACEFEKNNIPLPSPLPKSEPLMKRIQNAMFLGDKDMAFSLLRKGLTETAFGTKQSPRKSVYDDQIVWGRSPVRIDIAGGWTDTPPFSLMEGGNVVNLAIELNGQPPLQAYVKPCKEAHVILRSIDLGASEVVETYEQLADFNKVGSPFSIPKAALVLAGFQPGYSAEQYNSLKEQLESFGSGIELSMLSAIPAGSGLGTSSVLASTVLGALNDFCGLAWDKNEIGHRTLVLEQLLTTGGGWQDQFGGIFQGVKLLQTEPGFNQNPIVRWLPTDLYNQQEYRACHLLYYTGITRTAKDILSEIVRRMFLNQHDQLALLREMKSHTLDMYDAIQRNDFRRMGLLMRKTWIQNQTLDKGTNPPAVAKLSALIDDLCLGYKLPGAGGGGFLYMVAKDPEAAARIKQLLNANSQNANARFVDMTLSRHGLQVSRS